MSQGGGGASSFVLVTRFVLWLLGSFGSIASSLLYIGFSFSFSFIQVIDRQRRTVAFDCALSLFENLLISKALEDDCTSDVPVCEHASLFPCWQWSTVGTEAGS